MKTRFGFAALIAVLLGASGASAADISPVYKAAPVTPQGYNWGGFYIGGYAGYAWGKSNASGASDCPTGVPVRLGYYCDTTAGLLPNQAAVSSQVPGDLSSSRSNWGGYTGYNWQSGNWVIGAEADLGSFHLGASRTSSPLLFPAAGAGTSFIVGSSVDTDWLFTGRGRLGWAMSNLMIYGTGGVGITRLSMAANFQDNTAILVGTNGTGSGTSSSNRVGYVVGGGIEWALTQNWILRGEYLYMDFGSSGVNVRVSNPNFFIPTAANNVITNVDLSAQVLRVGLSYKFDWGKAPVVAKY